MTLIEFFSEDPVLNAAGIVALHPQRVVFLGDVAVMEAVRSRYRALVNALRLDTALEFRAVDAQDFDAAGAVLSALCDEFSDAAFDLTGGEDVVLAAMGQVYEQRLAVAPVSMHRFDVNGGTLHRVPDNSRLPLKAPLALSIEQFVRLHGGAAGSSADGAALTRQAYSPEALDTLAAMWSVCAEDPNEWNKVIGSLCGMVKYARSSRLPRRITIDRAAAREKIHRFDDKAARLSRVLKSLDRVGAIRLHGDLDFEYASPLVRQCLSKEGNLLELYTLFTAKSLKTADGNSLFCDADCGVYMDWDGRFGQPNNTHNEVDVMLMRGVVPIFISCKNGEVGDEELYKLRAVSDRFGGPRAKAVLVATFMDRNPMTGAGLRERALQMGITLIDRADKLSPAHFADSLRAATT